MAKTTQLAAAGLVAISMSNPKVRHFVLQLLAKGVKPLAILAVAFVLAAKFVKTSVPRGDKARLQKQIKFEAGSGIWSDDKDLDGKPIKVYTGEKGYLGLDTQGPTAKDEKGLVLSYGPHMKTTYDMTFALDQFDDRSALGRCVRQHSFKDALLPNGKPNPKPMVLDIPAQWEFLTYKEMKQQARAFGTCLRRAPFELGQREKIAIWSGNSAEWMLTDLACAAFNFTSVSVYDTLGPDAASYIIADSGAKVVVCEEKTFKRVPAVIEDDLYKANKGSDVQLIVVIGTADAKTKQLLEAKGIAVMTFEECVKKHGASLERDTPPTKDDLVTIMYTSGTTGNPKGVMLKHENVVSTVCMTNINPSVSISEADVHLSYLPLAHIFERQLCTGFLSQGAVVYFASNGSKGLLKDLEIVRPTFFAGVPKVFENIRDAVKRQMTGMKKKLLDAALNAKIADIETGCGYSPMWDKLIFSKTKLALGGRVRFCLSGGAPISKDTLQFVLCALAPVIQGYGATETSACVTLTQCCDLSLGHVGPPVGTCAVRLSDVPDMNYFSGSREIYSDAVATAAFQQGKAKSGGEVWCGGPGVSPGYYDPSQNGLKQGIPSNGMAKKTTEEFFQDDGWSWFKTGDIGSWNPDGTLKIVDRRKNMFKTSLGEYVPVEEVEKTYQDTCPFVDFVFLPKETKVAYVGLVVVVSESIGPVMRWAKENNVAGDEATVVGSDKFKSCLLGMFNEAAQDKKLQRFMWIQKSHNIHAVYLPANYQEEWVGGVVCPNGKKEALMTATFKARRTQLDQYFAPAFPKMYPDRPADHILP